jgi:hypothetical protein
MNIYTFYEPVNELNHRSNEKILEIWKKSWAYYGWTPIVLNLKDAKKHKFYDEYKKKCETYPTLNFQSYEILCYLRWLAMAELGGWHCDFDIMNYGFEPVDYENKIVTCTHYSLAASTIHLPKSGYEKILNLIYNYEITEKDINHELKKYHVSDMTILINLRNECNIDLFLDCEAFYSSSCYGYSHEHWTNTKLVHFASAFTNEEKLKKIIEFEKTSKFLT